MGGGVRPLPAGARLDPRSSLQLPMALNHCPCLLATGPTVMMIQMVHEPEAHIPHDYLPAARLYRSPGPSAPRSLPPCCCCCCCSASLTRVPD